MRKTKLNTESKYYRGERNCCISKRVMIKKKWLLKALWWCDIWVETLSEVKDKTLRISGTRLFQMGSQRLDWEFEGLSRGQWAWSLASREWGGRKSERFSNFFMVYAVVRWSFFKVRFVTYQSLFVNYS